MLPSLKQPLKATTNPTRMTDEDCQTAKAKKRKTRARKKRSAAAAIPGDRGLLGRLRLRFMRAQFLSADAADVQLQQPARNVSAAATDLGEVFTFDRDLIGSRSESKSFPTRRHRAAWANGKTWGAGDNIFIRAWLTRRRKNSGLEAWHAVGNGVGRIDRAAAGYLAVRNRRSAHHVYVERWQFSNEVRR